MRKARVRSTDSWTNSRTRTSLDSGIGAEHANSRAEFRTAERDHVLADMLSNNLTVLRVGMGQNVLNEVVAILVTCDIDQWNAWSVETSFTDSVKVAPKEINTTNLEAFLNNLGGELIHAIFRSIANDVVNCTASISWGTMFANVLDAPIAELTMSNNINAGKNLFNAGTL